MKMDTSYMCSLHIWNMKFCCVLGYRSFIQQVITSRGWSSPLFTTLFQPLKCTRGTAVVVYCAVRSDRFLRCSYSNCDVSRQLSALYRSHAFENFGFWCFPKKTPNQTPPENPQSKKPHPKTNKPSWLTASGTLSVQTVLPIRKKTSVKICRA